MGVEYNQLSVNEKWADAVSKINNNSAKTDVAITQLDSSIVKNKGYFTNLQALQLAYPIPQQGWYAWVGNSYPGTVYDVINGVWHNTDVEPTIDQIDLTEYAKTSLVYNVKKTNNAGFIQSLSDLTDNDLKILECINNYYIKCKSGKFRYRIGQTGYSASLGLVLFYLFDSNGNTYNITTIENDRVGLKEYKLSKNDIDIYVLFNWDLYNTKFPIDVYRPIEYIYNGNGLILEGEDISIPLKISEELVAIQGGNSYFLNKGYVNRPDGRIIDSDLYVNTGYIYVLNKPRLEVRGYNSIGASVLSFYDKNANFISSFPETSIMPIIIDENVYPTNAYYIRCTGKIGQTYYINGVEISASYVFANKIYLDFQNFSSETNLSIKNIQGGEDLFFKNGYIRRGTGEVRGETGTRRCTPFIDIEGSNEIEVKGYSSDVITILAFYDYNFTYISDLNINNNTTSVLKISKAEYPINAKYIRATGEHPSIEKYIRGISTSSLVRQISEIKENNGEDVIYNYIHVRKDSLGDFTSIRQANASIINATKYNRYVIYVYDDIYITNITENTAIDDYFYSDGYGHAVIMSKDYVDYVGVGAKKLIYVEGSATNTTEVMSSINAVAVLGESKFENFKFVVKNARRPVHCSLDINSGKTIYFKNCELIHLGNVDGKYTTVLALGLDSRSRMNIIFEDCEFNAWMHSVNNHTYPTNYDKSNVIFSRCRFLSGGYYIINPYNSDKLNIQMNGCQIDKGISYRGNWYGYEAGDIRKLKPELSGFGNGRCLFINECEWGYGLRIYSDLPITKASGTALIALGLWETGKDSNGYYIQFFNELRETENLPVENTADIRYKHYIGHRLGDCTSDNKFLTLKVGEENVTVVFASDYSGGNDYTVVPTSLIDSIITEMEIIFGTDKINLHKYSNNNYPDFTDFIIKKSNSYTSAINKGSLIKFDGLLSVLPCTNNDLIDGILLDDIIPSYEKNGNAYTYENDQKGRVNIGFAFHKSLVHYGGQAIKGSRFGLIDGLFCEKNNGEILCVDDDIFIIDRL